MQNFPQGRMGIHFLVSMFAVCVFAGGSVSGQSVTEFGSAEFNEKALIGILYDTKINQSREKMPMDIPAYNRLIDEFLASGWDESVLNRFFRASRALYSTQIFIPLISAGAAPAAFGVEDIVKPMYWLVHYKGQVTPPSSGRWRFWGWGEEVCSVAVNGENVLLANWKQIKTPSVNWKSPEKPGQVAANGRLVAGDWIELQEGDVIDLDVLIGERGGGVFASFLLIEKEGATYAMHEGNPVLPVFQLARFKTPQPESSKKGPVIAEDGPIWSTVP